MQIIKRFIQTIFSHHFIWHDCYVYTGQRASPETVAPATCVHRFFSDLAAHYGPHVHLFHPGGLLQEALLGAVPAPSPRALPNVRRGSYPGLVGGLASRVHEVSGTGSTWGRSQTVIVAEAEAGDEGKRWDPGTLSWHLAGNSA